ncbi:MAG: hypothetical protein ABT05_03395 [Lautropia sp. SCN 66-9]|nr:MAG: hypothetical protein ABT05_03395 [Lautropia sp. SCN 66-9]
MKDRGRGIDAQLEAQLFNAFVTTKADGLGIGLSLCRSVVESHGGHLNFERRADGGSIFSCMLPLHAETAYADVPDAPPPDVDASAPQAAAHTSTAT